MKISCSNIFCLLLFVITTSCVENEINKRKQFEDKLQSFVGRNYSFVKDSFGKPTEDMKILNKDFHGSQVVFRKKDSDANEICKITFFVNGATNTVVEFKYKGIKCY